MTYFGVLFRFVVIPIVILVFLHYWHEKRNKPIPRQFSLLSPSVMLASLIVIAVIYTTPWDNYLVATSVWWYDPDLVTGIIIGWVPIEEYTFFVLQTVMSGLWLLLLMRYIKTDQPFVPNVSIRKGATLFVGVIWLISVIILAVGWKAGNYLGLELVWALPPIALQLAVGADILWHYRYWVTGAVISATVYLCVVDKLAIASGTWTINPELTTGLFIGGLPFEEALFFLLTNILLIFGLTLGLSTQTAVRLPEKVRALLQLN